jgi:hypothetical protein
MKLSHRSVFMHERLMHELFKFPIDWLGDRASYHHVPIKNCSKTFSHVNCVANSPQSIACLSEIQVL